jgi:CubicO group peptidase (beta-lactamase class C family)
MRLSTFLLFISFSFIVIRSYGQAEKTVSTDNQLKTFVDSAVQKAATSYMQDSSANGISIGVYYKGAKYSYNYGEIKKGSGKLPTAETFHNLGSVAKTFITTMLAEAVIEHKAKLTDDIRKYLPSRYPNLQYKGHPIRLVDLANHTSALPSQFHTFPKAILDSINKLDRASQGNYFNGYNEDSLLADLHHIKPDTIPGFKYQYNGNAMLLLELLVERIFHQSYEQVVTHYLQNTIGMYHTKMLLTNDEIKQLAQGYDNHNIAQRYMNYIGFTGGPSMNSTIDDMLIYLQANLDEKDRAVKLTHELTWGDKNGFALGLGWMMDTYNGERYIYHDGHTGIGFNTHCIFYPRQQIGFIIIVNDNISQDKVSAIEDAIKEELDKH